MKQLKYKNGVLQSILAAVALTILLFIGFLIAFFLAYLFGDGFYISVLIVFLSLIALIWLLMVLRLIFSGTVIITDDEIKLCQGKRVKWRLQKSDIEECRYNKITWHDFILPIGIENMALLQFKLKGKGVSRNNCSLSIKQVNRICDVFGCSLKIM